MPEGYAIVYNNFMPFRDGMYYLFNFEQKQFRYDAETPSNLQKKRTEQI